MLSPVMLRKTVSPRLATHARPSPLTVRFAHQASQNVYGFRKPPLISIEDYTPEGLANRNNNAPLLRYVDCVRRHGHRGARLDPLDIMDREDEVAALNPQRYDLHPDARYPLTGIVDIPARFAGADGSLSVKELTEHLRATYVSTIGHEFMHSTSKAVRNWFMHTLETAETQFTVAQRRRIWELMTRSECLDRFLQAKFPNVKRYGLEGAESMLPALDVLFEGAARAGISNAVLCMPHRGRLSLLTELLEYKPEAMFHKMKGGSEVPEDLIGATGDVLSHLVSSPTLRYDDAQLKISMLPNPSHLEAVNSVAMGVARAKEAVVNSEGLLGDEVLCVQLHGDAAFVAQGVVMESLGLSELPHYGVGGSVHVVVNNNLGFTTPSTSARSSLYASDIGKMLGAPVMHVNGDYPEAVARAVDIALQYRMRFRRDVIIDLITYRRWGHNELDEPAFTQPSMYEKIRTRKSVPEMYEERLKNEGVLTDSEVEQLRGQRRDEFESALAQCEAHQPEPDMLKGKWSSCVWPASPEADHDPQTGVSADKLRDIGKASVAVPQGFNLHSRLGRHIKQRLDSLEKGEGINWATAEALAFGTLLDEGSSVRISGQDVGRGTFSQRHAMLVDQRTELIHVPLNTGLSSGQGQLELANSSLSEAAVLGFEVGMSWERPDLLPIWEAQFGDFGNGAQTVIDTYVSCSEAKWLKQSALVMLMPHGFDGAGPDHSSARIERYLQLTNDPFEPHAAAYSPNLPVVNLTTPHQYFHLLRRQMKRNYRKPLVVAAPKGLLRSPVAASKIEDFGPDRHFQPVINDPAGTAHETVTQIERIILCSGKHFYELHREREKRGLSQRVALVRIEELSPFPFSALNEILGAYDNCKEYVWAQEEPRNQGAWSHVAPRIDAILAEASERKAGASTRLKYAGRKECAVPAVGVGKWHRAELGPLLSAPFEGLE